ncbi:histidine--tRNA ligase, cytoplasmic [Trifolium repens]|nr:histidine--tRNA ligase, cytoplasmic [Trifolium repens]
MLSVSAILDDQLAALAVFSDVAAAFSCEASNADVTVFNLIDSKEEVSVATVMRILLNGSKLVGKQNVPSIIKIPEVHGLFRETVSLVLSVRKVIFEIKLNHRKLLDGMMQICGVPPEKFRTICSSIDKLDKQPFEQIRKEMVDEKGLTAETADRIGTFVKEKGHPLTLLSKLKQEGSAFIENAGSVDALNDLEILFNALDGSKRLDKVVFDLSLARGLDYYTGVIFEAVFKGGAQVGSIAAGGRYDNLIGMFGSGSWC